MNSCVELTNSSSDNEYIIAISGLHGSSQWGLRVLQLSFAIYNSGTGQMRVAGVCDSFVLLIGSELIIIYVFLAFW